MTKNTKLHKIKHAGKAIIYRDLVAEEVCFLHNIKNETIRFEFAAKLAIQEPTDTKEIPWPILLQIGSNTLNNSSRVLRSKDLFEITVKEFRQNLEREDLGPMPLIGEILKALPGQSITDLLKLTYVDLIEIACLCEKIRGIQILNVGKVFGKKKGVKLVDPKSLPDDGKSLRRKMEELNAFLGTPKL